MIFDARTGIYLLSVLLPAADKRAPAVTRRPFPPL